MTRKYFNNREKYDVLRDILELTKEPSLFTRIMYRVFMPSDYTRKALRHAVESEIIEESYDLGRKYYAITDKGRHVLQLLEEMKKMLVIS